MGTTLNILVNSVGGETVCKYPCTTNLSYFKFLVIILLFQIFVYKLK